MSNKTLVVLPLLLACNLLAGTHCSAAATKAILLPSTYRKAALAVVPKTVPSSPVAKANNLKPNWTWTKSINIFGYVVVHQNGNLSGFVDRVVVESSTKGFSWSKTWNRSGIDLRSRIKWSISSVPVDKAYKITAYARSGKQSVTYAYVPKPTLFASDFQVNPDFVFNY